MRQYIGARYVPKYSDINDGVWDNSYTYDALEIVKYGNDYYTSKQPVPTGVAITNTDYWVLTGNYNGAIATLDEKINSLKNEVSAIAVYTYSVNLSEDDLQEVINDAVDNSVIYCNGTVNTNGFTISDKQLTIINGNFTSDARPCTISNYGVKPIFTCVNSNVHFYNCEFKANSYNEYPFIYARSGIDRGEANDSNVEAISASNSSICLDSCHFVNVMGAYGYRSTIKALNNIALTSMFLFSEESTCISQNNNITMQDSGLTSYYHTFYPNTRSDLISSHDNVISMGEYQDFYSGGVSGVPANASFYNLNFYGELNVRLLTTRGGTIKFYNSDITLTKSMSVNNVVEAKMYNTSINIAKQRSMFNEYLLTFVNGININSSGNQYADATTAASNLYPLDGISAMLLDGSLELAKIALYDSDSNFIRNEDPYGWYTEFPGNAAQFRAVKKIGSKLFGYVYR